MKLWSLVPVVMSTVVASTAAAQTSPARAAITEKLNTDKAHVYVATLQPHAPSPSPAGHATNRVLIYLDDGAMTRREGSGPVDTITFARGDVRWRPASGGYVAENTADHPIRILEIDLKSRPAGPAPTTRRDPTLVDASHYAVVFENEQVRVLRIHFNPHEKSAEHEHLLDRVVVYLNDQGQNRRDDVRMAGAAVHVEQNDADTPADRIAVELK